MQTMSSYCLFLDEALSDFIHLRNDDRKKPTRWRPSCIYFEMRTMKRKVCCFSELLIFFIWHSSVHMTSELYRNMTRHFSSDTHQCILEVMIDRNQRSGYLVVDFLLLHFHPERAQIASFPFPCQVRLQSTLLGITYCKAPPQCCQSLG